MGELSVREQAVKRYRSDVQYAARHRRQIELHAVGREPPEGFGTGK